jgi:hypothetical protein
VDSLALARQWVACSGESDHNPIVLELSGRVCWAPSPFKFFEGWLKDPEYQALVRKFWTPLGPKQTSHATILFLENLKKVKHATISWAHEKKLKEDWELLNIEKMLLEWQGDPDRGFCSREGKDELVHLELRRRTILAEKEALWRLKSCVIWLACGDENTKFFHSFAKGKKLTNTIWGLTQGDGQLVNTFEGLSSLGISHFKDLFKAQVRSLIVEIVKVARLFPHFVEDDEQESLMKEVYEQELLVVMRTFQKGKSLGHDGWSIEFYLGFFDLLGNDILKVVEVQKKWAYS